MNINFLSIAAFYIFLWNSKSNLIEVHQADDIPLIRNYIILLYSSVCSTSSDVLQTFEKTYFSYYEHDPSFSFLKVDISLAPLIENEFETQAYPTLLLCLEGKANIKYDLDLNPEDIRYFLMKHTNNTLPEDRRWPNMKPTQWKFTFGFIGNKSIFKRTFLQFRDLCFENEIVPCVFMSSIDQAINKDLNEIQENVLSLWQYVQNILSNQTNSSQPKPLKFDSTSFAEINRIKHSHKYSDLFSLSPEELMELDQILQSSDFFSIYVHNSTFWRTQHSKFDPQINLKKEALLLIKDNENGFVEYRLLNKEIESENSLKSYLRNRMNDFKFKTLFLEFNHRIRKHMLEQDKIGLVLFAKKKHYSSNYHIQYYVNQTRELFQRVFDDQLWTHGQRVLNQSLILILDPLQSTMARRLAGFLGVSDEGMPQVYAFKMKNNINYIERVKLVKKEGDHYFMRDLLNLLEMMYYENVVKRAEIRQQSNPNNSGVRSRVTTLTGVTYEKLLTIPQKNTVIIVEFTSEHCRPCFNITASINQLSNEFTYYRDYTIKYMRLDVDKNDVKELPTHFIPTSKICIPGAKPICEDFDNLKDEDIKKFISAHDIMKNIDL